MELTEDLMARLREISPRPRSSGGPPMAEGLPPAAGRRQDEARRRIERDLHDGAQQRLVSLALALRMVEAEAGPDVDPGVK